MYQTFSTYEQTFESVYNKKKLSPCDRFFRTLDTTLKSTYQLVPRSLEVLVTACNSLYHLVKVIPHLGPKMFYRQLL